MRRLAPADGRVRLFPGAGSRQRPRRSTIPTRTRPTERRARSRASISRGRKVVSVCVSPTTSAQSDRRDVDVVGVPDRDGERRGDRAVSDVAERRRIHRSVLRARARRGNRRSRRRVDASQAASRHGRSGRPGQALLVGLRRMSRPRGSRAALQDPARRARAWHGADERVPADSRTEHRGDHRPSSAGEVLRRARARAREPLRRRARKRAPHEHEARAPSRSEGDHRLRRRDGHDAVQQGRVHQPVLR